MLDSLLTWVSDSNWTYLVVFAFALGDVLFPLIPSETALITAGALAVSGDLRLEILIVCAGLGAVLGDNIAYGVGRFLKGFVEGRVFAGDRRRHLERAERLLDERGGALIVIGRFIPGGRSAVAFGAGALHFRWPRFLAWDVFAAALWATYGGVVGFVGGKTFEESPLLGIGLALGIAFVVAGLIEGGRLLRRRQLAARDTPDMVTPGDGGDGPTQR